MAEALVQAGADVTAVKDDGEPAIETHIIHGRRDIVAVFKKHGARDHVPRWDSPMQNGGEVLVEHLKESSDTEGLAHYEMSSGINYGYVLPVQSLEMSAHARAQLGIAAC